MVNFSLKRKCNTPLVWFDDCENNSKERQLVLIITAEHSKTVAQGILSKIAILWNTKKCYEEFELWKSSVPGLFILWPLICF